MILILSYFPLTEIYLNETVEVTNTAIAIDSGVASRLQLPQTIKPLLLPNLLSPTYKSFIS